MLFRLYYQYNNERIMVCLAPVHGLIHLADDIRNTGPAWMNAEWVMERGVQMAKGIVRYSPSHPFVTLQEKLKHKAQTTALENALGIKNELDLE